MHAFLPDCTGSDFVSKLMFAISVKYEIHTDLWNQIYKMLIYKIFLRKVVRFLILPSSQAYKEARFWFHVNMWCVLSCFRIVGKYCRRNFLKRYATGFLVQNMLVYSSSKNHERPFLSSGWDSIQQCSVLNLWSKFQSKRTMISQARELSAGNAIQMVLAYIAHFDAFEPPARTHPGLLEPESGCLP